MFARSRPLRTALSTGKPLASQTGKGARRMAAGLRLLLLAGLGAVAGSAGAQTARDTLGGAQSPALNRIVNSGLLKVCIWPDYYAVSFRHPRDGRLSGVDIDLSQDLARELGVQLRYVESSFPRLIEDLETERCDVAMFAVAVSPERQARLDFTQPYMQSDIYGVTTRASRVVRRWGDIDQPGVVVAVQSGTLVATAIQAEIKRARIVVVQPPATREAEVTSGRADVFMTDYPYSRRLIDNTDWARLVAPDKPFHVRPYAYAIKRGDAAWLARLNTFVTAIKRDGRLRATAERYGLAELVVP